MKIRAKLWVESVKTLGSSASPIQEIQMRAVGGNKVQKQYPSDGTDEDNTFAKFTPSADFRMTVMNPALLGKFEVEQKYYVDMTLVEE